MNTENSYDAQAATFLAENGLKLRATLSNTKQADWHDSLPHNHYRVTIWRVKKIIGLPSRIVFDYFGSANDYENKKHPTAYDVLYCVSADLLCPDNYMDFLSEYGYHNDSDSRKLFKKRNTFAKRLNMFFFETEKDELAEIR